MAQEPGEGAIVRQKFSLPDRVFCDNCKKIRPFVTDSMGCATDVVCGKCHLVLLTFHDKDHSESC